MDKHQSKQQSLPTDEDYLQFAERFIDAVLDPRQPWLVQYILAFGFPPVPTWYQIDSGALASKMRQALDAEHWNVDEWLYDALQTGDRKTLIAYFTEEATERKLTTDELSRLLACTDFKQLKKSLKGLAKPFKFRPGPTPPIERQYDEALKCAERLYPLLLEFLHEQGRGTANTPREIINYLAKDFPESSKFLLDNLSVLEACIRDKRLFKKAKTRTYARAHVLADAIAGSVHLGRRTSTAVEYLRTERRKRRKSSC